MCLHHVVTLQVMIFSSSEFQPSLMLTFVWLFSIFLNFQTSPRSGCMMNMITPLELHVSSYNFTTRVSATKTLLGWGVPTSEMPIFIFWPSVLKLWTSPWKYLLGPCSEIINVNWVLYISRAYQAIIRPVHCWDILIVWILTLTLWPLPRKSCPARCLKNINDNCFIFLGHINLSWDLCMVESFLPLFFEIMTFMNFYCFCSHTLVGIVGT